MRLHKCVLGLGIALMFSVFVASVVEAKAVTVKENISVPFDLFVFIPCANDGAGEVLVLSGRLHVLAHLTTNDNGSTLKTHFQPQGIHGIGVVSGDTYHATGVTQSTETVSVHGADTFTFVNNFRIIGTGPGNNLLLHDTVHVTVNANGELTAFVDNVSVACR